MAISTGQVSVTSTRALVLGGDEDGAHIDIFNSGNTECFIGDETVTSANGYYLDKDTGVDLSLAPLEAVYVVCASEESTSISTDALGHSEL